MMTPLIHYLFAFLVIYAAGYHVRHRILSSAALAVLINLIFEADHLFPAYASEHIKLFHNITFAVFIPVALFLVSAVAENRYSAATGVKDSRYQRMFLMVLLVSTSHIMLDMAEGGKEYIFYPFVKTSFVLNSSVSISYPPLVDLNAWFLLLVLYGVLVLFVRALEGRIYVSMEGAADDSLREDTFSYGFPVRAQLALLFARLSALLSHFSGVLGKKSFLIRSTKDF